MELQKFDFKNSDLKKVPKNQRNFFILILNFLTELNIVNKTKIPYTKKIEDKITEKSIHCHQIFLTLMEAGKLYEGWMILDKNYFNQKFSKTIQKNLSEEGTNNLKEISKYFKSKNNLSRIRNKFAFHSDRDEIQKQYDTFEDDEPFTIYWSEYVGNSFSTTYFSVLNTILNEIDKDTVVAVKKLSNETQTITFAFKNFIEEILQYYLDKIFGEGEIVHVPDQVKIYNDSFPYFFDGKTFNNDPDKRV